MPGTAADVVAFSIDTLVPPPIDGFTPFGSYVMGSEPTSVPVTIGLAGSRVSASVLRVTRPLNAWFRETFRVPTLAVTPVVGRVIVPGEPTVKSGIAMTSPG